MVNEKGRAKNRRINNFWLWWIWRTFVLFTRLASLISVAETLRFLPLALVAVALYCGCCTCCVPSRWLLAFDGQNALPAFTAFHGWCCHIALAAITHTICLQLDKCFGRICHQIGRICHQIVVCFNCVCVRPQSSAAERRYAAEHSPMRCEWRLPLISAGKCKFGRVVFVVRPVVARSHTNWVTIIAVFCGRRCAVCMPLHSHAPTHGNGPLPNFVCIHVRLAAYFQRMNGTAEARSRIGVMLATAGSIHT